MAFPLSRFRNDPKMHNAITYSMLIIIHRLMFYGFLIVARRKEPTAAILIWRNQLIGSPNSDKNLSICTIFVGCSCCQKWIIRCNAAAVSRRNFYRIIIFEFAFTQSVDCHSICLAMAVRGRATHIYIHAIDASILKHAAHNVRAVRRRDTTHSTHTKESEKTSMIETDEFMTRFLRIRGKHADWKHEHGTYGSTCFERKTSNTSEDARWHTVYKNNRNGTVNVDHGCNWRERGNVRRCYQRFLTSESEGDI